MEVDFSDMASRCHPFGCVPSVSHNATLSSRSRRCYRGQVCDAPSFGISVAALECVLARGVVNRYSQHVTAVWALHFLEPATDPEKQGS